MKAEVTGTGQIIKADGTVIEIILTGEIEQEAENGDNAQRND